MKKNLFEGRTGKKGTGKAKTLRTEAARVATLALMALMALWGAPGAPATAQTDALHVTPGGDVGIGIDSPIQDLHVHDTSGSNVQLKLTYEGIGTTNLDGAQFAIVNSVVYFTNREDGDMQFFTDNAQKLLLDNGNFHVMTGNLNVTGTISSGGIQLNVPDYVFEPDYSLMPLGELRAFIAENKHLPNVPSAREIEAQGSVNMTQMQMTLLRKVEELTLYILEQRENVEELLRLNAELTQRVGELEGSGER